MSWAGLRNKGFVVVVVAVVAVVVVVAVVAVVIVVAVVVVVVAAVVVAVVVVVVVAVVVVVVVVVVGSVQSSPVPRHKSRWPCSNSQIVSISRAKSCEGRFVKHTPPLKTNN